ncbi:MAG: membrane protein insertase YidC [Phycisphaerales bacterium]
MPQPPNKVLRIIVPILFIIGGVLVAWAVYVNSTKQQQPGPASTNKPAEHSSATNTPGAVETPANTPGLSTAPQPSPDAPIRSTDHPGDPAAKPPTPVSPADTPPAPPTARTFTAQFHPGTPSLAPIGNLAAPFRMQVRFSPFGAGIESIDLTDIYQTISQHDPERLQSFIPLPASPRSGIAPFAVDGVEIDGEFVPLFGKPDQDGSFWTQTRATSELAEFQASILDSAGKPAVLITRIFRLPTDSYDIILEQRAQNLTDRPLAIVWRQWGPSDLPTGLMRSPADYRRLRFGYLTDPAADPGQQIVRADQFVEQRSHWLGSPAGQNPQTGQRFWNDKTVWPNDLSTKRRLTPVWVAMTNRYFAVAMHPLLDPGAQPGTKYNKALSLAARVDRFVMDSPAHDAETMVLYLYSAPQRVAPAQAGNFDAGIFAGPLSPAFMSPKTEPRVALVDMKELVVYTMGGMCWWCTFQWLTHPLSWFLRFLHDNVVFDYALAIMILVVCVRTLLHPVTKWSQISMMRFSKQMSALGPKQKKIQEKYKDDPARMRQELAQLMREENISYKGMLGCLPAFLQSPIWIALYAMLYFMYELRHEPAFFGLFQWLSASTTGRRWAFLADLSEPDHFISFGSGFRIPIMGLVDSVNLLPILLGVVFFVQQKYMQPPPTTQLTPEQEQQQKIVKVMMVVLFPLMMYNTPSALVLYFIVNSTLGTLESRYIRRHATEKDLLTPKPTVVAAGVGTSMFDRKQAKPAKKPGFFARVQQLAEERAKQIDEAKRRQKKR